MFKRINTLGNGNVLDNMKKFVARYKVENPLQKGFACACITASLLLVGTTVGSWNTEEIYAAPVSILSQANIIVFPTASSSMVNISNIEETVLLSDNDDPSLSDDLVQNEEQYELLQSVVAPAVTENVIDKTSKDNYTEVQALKNKAEALADLQATISDGAVKSYEARLEAERIEAERKAALQVTKYVDNPNYVIKLTEEEYDLFCRLVKCEAGGEDEIGKILVANVVLNRINSPEFPNNLHDVAYARKQFTPVGNGLVNRVTYGQDIRDAIDKALSGVDYSNGATYFVAPRYASTAWFDRDLTKVAEHGCHYFYK